MVLFDPKIGITQILLFQVRVDLGAMAMKEYSTFPKALGLVPCHQIV